MSEAYSILEKAAASQKGGIRISADPLTLATTFNAMRRERTKYPDTFGHLIFKRKPDYIDVLNGKNILAGLEDLFR